jgi:hypothetical protein
LGSKVFWNSENQKENTGPCTENWVMTKWNFNSILECPNTNSIICFRRLKNIWKSRIPPS